MASIEELKSLAIEADARGDYETANAVMDKIEAAIGGQGPMMSSGGQVMPMSQVPPDVPIDDGAGITFSDPQYGQNRGPDRSMMDRLIGAGETGLSLLTGATGGVAGMVYGTGEGLLDAMQSGKFGTQEGVQMAQQAAMDRSGQFTYVPRTETGQEYVRETGEFLAPAQALAPMTSELGLLSRTAKQAGPALRNIGGKSAQAAQRARETIQAGKQAGIPMLTSDVRPPRTFAGKLGQAVTERIPVAGTGPVRAAQYGKRVSAIRNALDDYGVHEAANLTDDIMADLAKTRGGLVTRYADMKNSVIQKLSKRGTVAAEKTMSTLDDEIQRLKGLKSKDVQPAINILEDYKNAFSGQDIQNFELLRKQLGDRFAAQDLVSVKSTAEKSLNNIYRAVRDDMGEFIKKTGDRRDYTRWNVGNKRLSGMMGELKNSTLKSVLSKGQATPEQVRRLLFSQKPSEINALRKNLSPAGRNKAKVAILQEVVDKAGGIDNLTPEKFLTKLSKLDKPVNAFFSESDKTALNGLVKALNATRRASEASVKPPTGAELTAFAAPSGLSWMLGVDPVSGLAATGGVGLLARLYESRPIRNMLIRIGEAKGKTGPQIEALTNKLVSMPEYKAFIAAQAQEEESEK